MSIFSAISTLVADYELWKKYEPVLNELEAVLLKNGINVPAMLATSPAAPDRVVQAIQTKVNQLGAKPPLVVDGVIGPATIAAIWETVA